MYRNRRHRGRDCQHPINVRLLDHLSADALDMLLGLAILVAGDQTDVSLGNLDIRVPAHESQHGHIRVMLNHATQVGLVPGAPDPIENHTGDAERRIEGPIAQQ